MVSEQDLVRRIREARRMLALGGPPRVRSGGDFERVSVPLLIATSYVTFSWLRNRAQ